MVKLGFKVLSDSGVKTRTKVQKIDVSRRFIEKINYFHRLIIKY
jgi:hypothetical protein